MRIAHERTTSNLGRLRHGGRWRGLLLLLFVLSTTVDARAETWYEAYDQAQSALAAEDWNGALRHLDRALGENPSSGARTRTYGMRFVDYFPYLDLGVAYFHLGQLDAALEAFDTEESQGELERSPNAVARLADYRQRVSEERDRIAQESLQRRTQLVASNLAESRSLEGDGDLLEALRRIDRVLAVEPGHPEALATGDRLRRGIADQQRRAQAGQRFDELVSAGRESLNRGQLADAAGHFESALRIRDDPRVGALLDRTRQDLRGQIEQSEKGVQDDVRERDRFVAERLAQSRSLLARDQLEPALTLLQEVLAVAPDLGHADELRRQLLDRQRFLDQRTTSQANLEQSLTAAASALDAGRIEVALTETNRALAIDPGNADARRLVVEAYTVLNARLLAGDAAAPTLILDPVAETSARTGPEGALSYVTDRATVQLGGRAYDATPVTIEAWITDRKIEPASIDSRRLHGVYVTEFSFEERLPVGITSVEVRATDDLGLTSSRVVAMNYSVPFHRSPWAAATVGLGLAGVVIVAIGLRRRRHRRLLHQRFNPYVAGAPILDRSRFFGRTQLIDYVVRRIRNNSVMLYGERRIGKTSLQHRLKDHLATLDDPEIRFVPVYIDLQGIPEERFFATIGAEILHELAPRIHGLVEEAAPRGEKYGYRDLVRDLQRALGVLQQQADDENPPRTVRLALLIDEVDVLNDYDPRINQRLRSLFMRSFADQLVAVVSGVTIKKEWDREGSPWYNFFQEIEVTPFDAAEAKSLVTQPVRGVFFYDDGIVDEIVRRTDAKPYLVQRVCVALVERLHAEGRRRVTDADLDAACRIEELS